MVFLNPLYLWAFLGLAVPVAIHLWSRKEGRTIKVGSIKFLAESDPKKASSTKLNEIWLLILRLLALSILVLLLAGPVIEGDDSPSALTYLVEPSLLQHEEMKRILDTIGQGVEIKLLAADFPAYASEETVNLRDIPDYWQLVPEMQNLNSDSIIVFTAAYAAGFKGKRPQTNLRINWVQIIPDETVNTPIMAVQKDEALEIISVFGDHTMLDVEKEITSGKDSRINTNAGDSISLAYNGYERNIPLIIADTIRVILFHDENLDDQMRYIKSSLNAISEYLNHPMKIKEFSQDAATNDQDDLVVWLRNSPLKETDSPVLMWKPDSLANSLIEKGNKKNVHHLTRSLNSENIIEENFPEQLFQLLNINEELGEEIAKYDRRVKPLDEIIPLSGSMGRNIEMSHSRNISKYFWILLVIILIAERGLSAYRKQ